MLKSDTSNPQPEVPGESNSAIISRAPVLKSEDNDGEGSEEKAKEDQKTLL